MISNGGRTQRESVHLWIAVSIIVVLSAYRIASALVPQIESFFKAYTEFPVAEALSNVLFFWLLALLWVAYRRWHSP